MALSDQTAELPPGWLALAFRRGAAFAGFLRRHPTILFGMVVVLVAISVALLAPYLLPNPKAINPIYRLRPPGEEFWFGTDHLGRSILSRSLNGTRVSLAVGILVATVVTFAGVTIGLISGFLRKLDSIVMRVMDGIMAIPGVLLAIALMSLFGSSLQNVVIAISIPEIPRMARLVRSAVLSIREQPYIDAAITNGTKLPRLLVRHVLPNTMAPVLVQATYVFASAMILEAVLSFLGAGTPPEVASWGNMMAEGRQYLQRAPWMAAFPGILLAVLVLTVNVVGDALRDAIDPRLAGRQK
jgi:peptide/nickel transport system permease protein